MSHKDFSKEEIEKVYCQPGVTGRQAAKKLGITYRTFSAKLSKLGISFKKRESKYPQLNDKAWLKEEYIDKKKSVRSIAKELGATVGAVYSAIRWLGIETRTSRQAYDLRFPDGRFGPDSPRWKGGMRVGGEKGRYNYIYSPYHPKATNDGYVMEHRLVMEKKIGRFLKEGEIVHHLDGDGHNNSIENLLLTSKKQHFQDHFDAVKELNEIKKFLKDNNIKYEEKFNRSQDRILA